MKLVHSLVYSSTSGKVGGGLVSRGRHGSFVGVNTRKKTFMSKSQSTKRAFFARITSHWRNLTPAVVLQYNACAKAFVKSNFDGSSRTFTGFQLFFNYSFDRLLSGSSITGTFPFLFDNFRFNNVRFSASFSPLSLNMYYNVAPTSTCRLLFFASKPLPVGVLPKKSDYKYIITFIGNVASPRNIYTYYAAYYGSVFKRGLVIHFKVRQFFSLGFPYYPSLYSSCVIT